MPEEWFDVAYINFDKVILHGRMMFTNGEGFRQERYIEQILTKDQNRQIQDLNFKHEMEMQELLKGFVDA